MDETTKLKKSQKKKKCKKYCRQENGIFQKKRSEAYSHSKKSFVSNLRNDNEKTIVFFPGNQGKKKRIVKAI